MIKFAKAGSQRWLQVAIELRPHMLDQAIRRALALPLSVSVEWLSPRRHDGFREYRDSAALHKCGIDRLESRALSEFWPRRGPVWDALGRTSDGRVLFLEAKAHIAELASPASKAIPASMALIAKSLAETRRHFAPKATADWGEVFYQYANRLAHHYLFRHVNRLPTHLVFLYFLNAEDVSGPSSVLEWHGAIRLLHAALGLGDHVDPHVHDVFVDVGELKDAAP